MCMQRVILFVMLAGLTACGQFASPPQPQPPRPGSQTHTSANPNKGQIAQPEVKKGQDADASALLISFHGCADLLLTDSRGRKLGYSSAEKKSYVQIPGGIYDEGDLISDDEEDSKQQKPKGPADKQPDCVADKTVQVPTPIAGIYLLKIENNQAAAFKLEITSYGPDAKTNGHYVLSQQAGSMPQAHYQFELPPAPGTDFQIRAVAK